MKKSLIHVACCLILAVGSLAAAQKKQGKTVRPNQLRTQLSAALKTRATVVKDELARRSNWHGGQLFWLASIQPKQVGHYSIKYRYKYNDPLYSHVERELLFRVGKAGCLRNPLGNGYYGKFCLGDTVILPIAIENFTEHEFSLKFTEEKIEDEVPDASRTRSELQENPLSEHLVFIGNDSHVSLHRAGGYTLSYSAIFEARKPGRFNLSLSSSPFEAPVTNDRGGIAVIVLDRETPITAIAAREEVEGFTMGYDGREYVSSTGSNTSYITDVLIIQTGDRFTFEYGSEIHLAREEREERNGNRLDAKPAKPTYVQRLSFWFDANSGYNEWIKNWLP